MAPFVIPGVTLEEVLGAAKTDTGRRLYTLAATAARDLADHVRDRRQDGDLEPVTLAGAPAADPPSAAGAPPAASGGTVSRSTAELEDLLNDAERDVRDYLVNNRGAWHSPRGIAAALELRGKAVSDALRTWRLVGAIEHNGGLRTAARYRFPPDAPPPAAVPYPVPVGPDGKLDYDAARAELEEALDPAAAAMQAQGAAGPPLSRRVRRELEAEAERQRREAERPPATNGAGTLDGQALHELTYRPATIPELAARLGIDRRDAAAVIRRLEDDDDLERRGRRGGEVIYGGLT